MTHNIKIHALAGNWSIRATGAIIGETRTALELVEHGYAPRIYFPHKDIAMAFLDYTEKTSHCLHKRDSGNFSFIIENEPIKNVLGHTKLPS